MPRRPTVATSQRRRLALALALVALLALGCAPRPVAGEECLEIVDLGSCGNWAVGKYHKQGDLTENGQPVWHNAGDHGENVRIIYHNDAHGWWLTKHTDLGGGGYPCRQGGKGDSPLGCDHFASPSSCGIQLCDKEL